MPQGSEDRPEGLTFRGLPRALWRWKWVVLGMAALATLGAYGLALQQTPMYRATVAMIYQPPVHTDTPFISSLFDPDAPRRALARVTDLVSKPDVVARAERIMGGPPRFPYQLSTVVVGHAAIGTYDGTVNISAMSPSATESADVANAYARAVIEWTKAQQVALIRKAQQAIKNELKAFTSTQSRGSPDYFALVARLQDLATLKAATTGDYMVVSPATAPAAPYAPHPTTAAAVGLVGGLIGGIALALVLEMFRTRPRGRRHVSHSSRALGSSFTP